MPALREYDHSLALLKTCLAVHGHFDIADDAAEVSKAESPALRHLPLPAFRDSNLDRGINGPMFGIPRALGGKDLSQSNVIGVRCELGKIHGPHHRRPR